MRRDVRLGRPLLALLSIPNSLRLALRLRLLRLLPLRLSSMLRRLSGGLRGGQIPRPALAARGRIDEPFDVSIVRGRSRRSSNYGVEDVVKVIGEVMTAWVDVDGGLELFDVYGFFDAPPDPILLRRKDGNIFLAKVVVVFARMLEHG